MVTSVVSPIISVILRSTQEAFLLSNKTLYYLILILLLSQIKNLQCLFSRLHSAKSHGSKSGALFGTVSRLLKEGVLEES